MCFRRLISSASKRLSAPNANGSSALPTPTPTAQTTAPTSPRRRPYPALAVSSLVALERAPPVIPEGDSRSSVCLLPRARAQRRRSIEARRPPPGTILLATCLMTNPLAFTRYV